MSFGNSSQLSQHVGQFLPMPNVLRPLRLAAINAHVSCDALWHTLCYRLTTPTLQMMTTSNLPL